MKKHISKKNVKILHYHSWSLLKCSVFSVFTNDCLRSRAPQSRCALFQPSFITEETLFILQHRGCISFIWNRHWFPLDCTLCTLHMDIFVNLDVSTTLQNLMNVTKCIKKVNNNFLILLLLILLCLLC